MKIDFNQPLIGFTDEPQMTKDKSGEERAYTLKDAAILSLRTPIETDNALGPLQKYELGEIGMLIHKGLDLTPEQVEMLKDRIGKVFVTGETIYAAWNLLKVPAKVQAHKKARK